MKDYCLSPTVHACRTLDGVVLLDLRTGQYLGIDNDSARAVAGVVEGWPEDSLGQERSGLDPHEITIVDELLRRDLLTRDRSPAAQRSTAAMPVRRIPHEAVVAGTSRIALHHRLLFAAAWIRAAMWMRHRSLHWIVNTMRNRKMTVNAQPAANTEPLAKDLASIFHRLRPWAYTANRQCLLDSIVLCEFLAHYRLFPTLVIGVLTQPFEAHSWVQHDDIVLNDTPEHVRRYVPVLSI